MDFFNISKNPNNKQQQPPLYHHAFNNVQAFFSNIIHRITNPHNNNNNNNNNNNPFCSISSSRSCSSNAPMPRWRKKNKSLSTYEIKKRMPGIPVYKLSNNSSHSCCTKTKDGRIRLLYFSKQDAEDYLHELKLERTDPHLPRDDDWIIIDTPLSEVLEYEVGDPPTRLVPESLQVKNAIEETNKNKSDFPVDSFCGVPVFKSNHVVVADPRTSKIYQSAYLRKEDLEKAETLLEGPEKSNPIEVAALEDIIQEMKDSSTSKSNNVLLIGPGMSWTWI